MELTHLPARPNTDLSSSWPQSAHDSKGRANANQMRCKAHSPKHAAGPPQQPFKRTLTHFVHFGQAQFELV
jgi:hypothetical protein